MSTAPRPRWMRLCALAGSLAFALILLTSKASALGFDRYHTQEEINSYMRAVAADHPELVRFTQLGYSREGRDIAYVTLSKSEPEAVPALYFNGTHHGNEKSSTEAILGLIDYLIRNRDSPQVSELLETYAIYLQPLVNPDGHAANVRDDRTGNDPNRDYSYPGRGDDQSFKISAIRLVKQLVEQIKPRAAIAYHSGMEAVLWPLCYSSQQPRDHDLFHTLARSAAQTMRMRLYAQSYYDYPSGGEFIDYVYLNYNTLALTFEVSYQRSPPRSQLLAVVQRSILGAMDFMTNVMQFDRGLLAIHRAPNRLTPTQPAFNEFQALATSITQ